MNKLEHFFWYANFIQDFRENTPAERTKYSLQTLTQTRL